MTEQERRAKKFSYIQETFPGLDKVLAEIKDLNGQVDEPLLFVDGKPVDSYTRRYVKEQNFKVSNGHD